MERKLEHRMHNYNFARVVPPHEASTCMREGKSLRALDFVRFAGQSSKAEIQQNIDTILTQLQSHQGPTRSVRREEGN